MVQSQLNQEHIDAYSKSIKRLSIEEALNIARKARDDGLEALDFVEKFIKPSVEESWTEYCLGESGLVPLVMAMYIAHRVIDVYKDQLPTRKGKVVLGTTGTFHDLGKNMVKEMLYIYNYDIYDIGSNAEPEDFIKKAIEVDADIIACNCMALSARPNTKMIVDKMEKAGIRNRTKLMVGGAVMTREWAEAIGADGYGDTMMDAVGLADSFMEELGEGGK